MSKINKNILSELERLVLNCTNKRVLLLNNALAKSKMKKTLSVTSGILALFSAGSIISVIVKYFGNEILQILAAVTAAMSGILSLFLTTYYDEEKISKTFEGASKYLSLRDKVYMLLINPNITSEKLFEELAKSNTEYAQLDELYSKYTQFRKSSRLPSLLQSKSSRPPLINLSALTDSDIHRRQKARNEAISKEMDNFNQTVNKLSTDENKNSE